MVETSALKKTYKMRRNSPGVNSIVVAMPFEVVEREARKLGLTVDEFIDRYLVICSYDSFDGVHYTFQTEVVNGRDTRGEGDGREIEGRGGEPSK